MILGRGSAQADEEILAEYHSFLNQYDDHLHPEVQQGYHQAPERMHQQLGRPFSQWTEDVVYHIYELDLGSGIVSKLTRGNTDNFFPVYLPSGDIGAIPTRTQHVEATGLAKVEATYKRGARQYLAKARMVVTLPDMIPRIK